MKAASRPHFTYSRLSDRPVQPAAVSEEATQPTRGSACVRVDLLIFDAADEPNTLQADPPMEDISGSPSAIGIPI